MPLEDPIIDNRSFEDIVKEARTLIPRYTPEWTDLNDNEPGLALVQLFAWMTDMTIFRLAQVPELNYIKFLQLLGIELLPAEPAHAEITFPLSDTQPLQTVTVPIGTQVAAAGAVGDEPVIFETDESLIALAAQLKRLLVFDGFTYTPVTQQNIDAHPPFEPLGSGADEGNALLLGFGYPNGFVNNTTFPATQVNLSISAHVESIRPETFSCGLADAQVIPSAKLVWEFCDGTTWLPLSVDKDTTLALTRSGHVLFRTPAPGVMKKTDLAGLLPEVLFWIRVRVDKAGYDHAPLLDAMRTNTIGATQAQTQRQEGLGGSNGRPDQIFTLAFRPVLKGTLHLQVQEGEDFEDWTEVEDFFASTDKDKHFVLNRTTGEVRFGDGTYGRIPVANPDNPDANIVAVEYRYGGGKKGNVAAGQLNNLPGGVPGADTSQIANLFPAVGGRDEETLAEAKRRAPQQLKNKDRAVTEEDFENLATLAPGVKRAKALALAHPGFPGVEVPGVVSVIVVPDGDEPNPMPGADLIRAVCQFLNQRRLLTTELFVVPPKYHKVSVRSQVIAEGNADLGEVKNAVGQRLLDYLHPLKGGEKGTGWVFGGDLFFSLIYRQVLTVPGALRIENLFVTLDGIEQPSCKDIQIPPGELVYSTEHAIEVTYEFRT